MNTSQTSEASYKSHLDAAQSDRTQMLWIFQLQHALHEPIHSRATDVDPLTRCGTQLATEQRQYMSRLISTGHNQCITLTQRDMVNVVTVAEERVNAVRHARNTVALEQQLRHL